VTAARRALLLRAAAALALALAGCNLGAPLRRDAAATREQIEEARAAGAERCAPQDLAAAEVDLDAGLALLERGEGERAAAHLAEARRGAALALERSRSCTPLRVIILDQPAAPEPAPAPAGVVIEQTDLDRDGVPDLEDRCPEAPGDLEHHGCPRDDPRGGR